MTRGRGLVLVALIACGGPERPASPPNVGTQSLDVAERGPARVTIELRAPRRARWLASTLSPATPPLDVVVTNHSSAPVDVSNLEAHLEAVREGVAFRCANEVGPAPGVREPTTLDSGESFVFERAIDCMLPLTGRYDVKVSVSFGPGPSRVTYPVRALTLDVQAPAQADPEPVTSIPGLHAAIGSSPLLVGESGRGSGRIAVALVNASNRPIVLPKLRLALQVFRARSPIPCEDAPIELDVPRPLAPGQTHRVPVDVSCLGLDTPGQYEVVVRLRIGEGNAETSEELGRLAVEISDDPARRMPPLLQR